MTRDDILTTYKLHGECIARSDNMWPTFSMGCFFWPATNIFNFTLVPSSHRVLYVNAAGLLWNSYLSWQTSEQHDGLDQTQKSK